MSVGRVADQNEISMFTKDGVAVHHEKDVMIIGKGDLILLGVRGNKGQYRIPFM